MKVKEFELNGYKVAIHNDELAESPDTWGNTDAFLVYDHRDFYVKVDGFDPQEINDHCANLRRLFYEGYFVFPVYAYIHSGVSLSLGRTSYPFTGPWDTSLRGFALIKRQKGWSWTRAKSEKIAQEIVKEWNTYLSGEVYDFTVKDSHGAFVDSCGGFYGIEHCEEEAKAVVAYCITEAFKARIGRLKTYIRERVPLEKRKELLQVN